MTATAEPGALRIGTSKTDITPAQPVTMAGYGSRKDLSKGVHDPLSARAIAFEQNGKRLVLVSTDVLGFYDGTAASIRKAILEACKLEPPELFLSAIHTHSAPTVTLDSEKHPQSNIEYTQTLQTQLVKLVGEALTNAVPAQIGVGAGSCPVGVNRREIVRDAVGVPKIVLGRNPAVLTDREVQVLKVWRAVPQASRLVAVAPQTGTIAAQVVPQSSRIAAVVFAYATHSTSLGPRNYLISGDIHGLAEQFLEKYLGGGVAALAFAGASGDIDPWHRVLPEFKTANGWVPEPVLMGTLLGEEVANVLNSSAGFQPAPDGPVKTAFKTLVLPGKPHVEGAAAASTEFNLTVGRVGEVAFVGLGGEVFNEIGKAIKVASPFAHTFVITHCNGAAGYLPTGPSYGEGGYEVMSSSFGPTAAEQVIKEAVRMLCEL